MEDFETVIRSARRKKRREGVLLTLLGVVFAAVGVFLLLVVENPWMGAVSVCFGLMGILTGIVEMRARPSLLTDIMLTVACFFFAATGAVMILSGLLAPGAWGWRGGGAGIIGGGLCLAFFGPGTVILVIVTIRRHRARRGR
ncbi:hypothetical protein GCM10010915_18960 [Microbacterium faecale]|uniref:Uncharacterized protein n=1 Tax=Microbacterium faecale TaxID=1804630 RepID=A0A916YBP7_9MICO|nr:hypothetical protein [Microbacterium faecale]GGD38349.1 hypothetical protein GCM10010915_18960 [Microbacterium faecale]